MPGAHFAVANPAPVDLAIGAHDVVAVILLLDKLSALRTSPCRALASFRVSYNANHSLDGLVDVPEDLAPCKNGAIIGEFLRRDLHVYQKVAIIFGRLVRVSIKRGVDHSIVDIDSSIVERRSALQVVARFSAEFASIPSPGLNIRDVGEGLSVVALSFRMKVSHCFVHCLNLRMFHEKSIYFLSRFATGR